MNEKRKQKEKRIVRFLLFFGGAVAGLLLRDSLSDCLSFMPILSIITFLNELKETPLSKVKEIIGKLKNLRNPPSLLLIGESGIGKSAVIRSVAGELGLEFVDIRLAMLEHSELIGLPKEKKNSYSYLPYEKLLIATERATVLCLDEFLQAEREVLKACFRIVLDREIGDGVPLHPGTIIVAISNYQNENWQNIPRFALLNRFLIMKVKLDKEFWFDWAKDHIHPVIVRMLRSNQNYLYAPELNLTPRTWEMISRLYSEGIDIAPFIPRAIYLLIKSYEEQLSRIVDMIKKNDLNVLKIFKDLPFDVQISVLEDSFSEILKEKGSYDAFISCAKLLPEEVRKALGDKMVAKVKDIGDEDTYTKIFSVWKEVVGYE